MVSLRSFLIFTWFILGFSQAARLDIENMDYDTLISLLADAEREQESNKDVDNGPKYEIYNNNYETRPSAGKDVEVVINKPSLGTILAPQVEVLHLIESFLQLKGEMASKIQGLINDNWELIRSIYSLLMTKVSKLHSFTLTGIHVLRTIFEFALQMLGSWELTKPAVSFEFDKFFGRR